MKVSVKPETTAHPGRSISWELGLGDEIFRARVIPNVFCVCRLLVGVFLVVINFSVGYQDER